MATHFSRQYRAALLDYLLQDDETGLDRAYALGRRAVENGIGLLELVSLHHDAINATLDAARASDDVARHVRSAQRFLLETLAPFDITHRGFMEKIAPPRHGG